MPEARARAGSREHLGKLLQAPADQLEQLRDRLLWRTRVSQLSEYLSLVGSSAADVGGVGGPVAAAGALPGDSDCGVDAEHAGEKCGGEFGSELEQRGGSCLSGVELELSESLAELVGADRVAGLSSGEQPVRGSLVTENGVRVRRLRVVGYRYGRSL